MADKRIKTELVIKAVDQYSSEIRNMTGVTGRFASKVRSEMGRMQDMRGPLRLIEDFRRQQAVVRKSADALDGGNEKTRQLLATIRATENPTAAMRREFDRARTAAGRLEEKHRRNRAELRGLQGQMQSAGVDTSDLAGEQRRLAGALDAANDKFARQAERMQRLKTMQDRIAEGRERMQRSLATAANLSFVGNASMQTGRRMLTGMSAPIMQAVEFESAMSDVRKVVDFESPAAFRAMSEDIMEMSARIPIAATGLAEIVAAGGQSGIAQENLTRFAERAAKIGVAFDISAGQSGDAMANIKTALGLTIDETVLLFDAMNHLSNNMASTAPKVLDFTTRVAVDGKVKGFNATETMAFGSAMIAAGSGADVAATSFRNMGRSLNSGFAATPAIRAGFGNIGLDAEKIAKRMQEDSVGTVLDVFERLQKLPKHMQAANAKLIFGDEARALAPLINNIDLLKDALGLVSEEQSYAGSAEAEYAERAKTTANNMQLLRNQTTRLGISIGEVVLPPLNEMLSKSQVFIDKLVAWTKENPKLTKTLVMGGVALGAMAVAGGFLLTAAAGLIGTMAVLRFGLVGLGARAVFAGGGIASLAGRFAGLRRLPRFRLSRLVAPLRWAAGLIPSIRWGALAGNLRWSSLIRPLAWIGRGALRFIPVIGWAALAGELAWHLLIKPMSWDKYLPSIDWSRVWGAFSWEGWLPEVDWSEFVSAIEWPDWVSGLTWRSLFVPLEWMTFVPRLVWRTFMPEIDWGYWFTFKWVDHLPDWSWDFIPDFDMAGLITWPEAPDWLKWLMGQDDEAAQLTSQPMQPSVMSAPGIEQLTLEQQAAARTVISSQSAGLPTAAHLQELRGVAIALRDEIAGIQGEIDNLGQGPMAASMALPHQQTMAVRKRELQDVEAELVDAEARSVSLTAALQVLAETEATPEINATSIDRALEKVARLSAQLRSMPGAGAGSVPSVRPAGARAFGGSVRAGLPYRVNEHTPKSEWFVPSVSGGILNVGQAQSAFMSHFGSTTGQGSSMARGAQRVRSASMATLAASALVGSAAAAAAGGGPANKSMSARVEIGSISIIAPSGVSDPEGLVDLIETRLGERISATFAASFSD
jgi:TP901 family phage tail tape measure protein